MISSQLHFEYYYHIQYIGTNGIKYILKIYGQLILLHAASSTSSSGQKLRGIGPQGIFYLSAAVDGLTSCMLSQAQAHIADCSPPGADLSSSLSRFQGIAIGSAFLIGNNNKIRSLLPAVVIVGTACIGIPLGAEIARKYSIRAPLMLSSTLCALNCVLIATLLPSTRTGRPSTTEDDNEFVSGGSIGSGGSSSDSSSSSGRSNAGIRNISISNSNTQRDESFDEECTNSNRSVILKNFWLSANPVGAAVMLSRSGRLLVGSLAYLLVCSAQAVRVVACNPMYVLL